MPVANVESVIQTMLAHSAETVRRALVLTMDLARASDSVDEFTQRFSADMRDRSWPSPPDCGAWNKERYFSGNNLEFIPVVPALLHLASGDVNQAITEGANFGCDCDTIASVAGVFAGAMHGVIAIRTDWIGTVEDANQDFFEELEGDPAANFGSMAERIMEALLNELAATKARAADLQSLLSTSCRNAKSRTRRSSRIR